jgi:hypothetical protein
MPYKDPEKRKEYHKQYNKKHYQENKEKYKDKNAKYETEHKDELRDLRKEWRKNNKDKERGYFQTWFSKNPNYFKDYAEANRKDIKDYQNKWNKEKRNSDPEFKLRGIVSQAVAKAIKRTGTKKKGSILKYLLYSITELRTYLESLFEPWMTWQNQGKYNAKTWDDNDQSTWTWNIDHIISQANLPYTSMEDENFQKCWALENLRPYSAKQNLLDSKRNKNEEK